MIRLENVRFAYDRTAPGVDGADDASETTTDGSHVTPNANDAPRVTADTDDAPRATANDDRTANGDTAANDDRAAEGDTAATGDGERTTPTDGTSAGAALRGVSVTVEPGEFVVLAGPNGSGKSTLIRQCNGLSTPDGGRVRVDGMDPAERPVAVRATVGTVFQRPRDQLVAARVGDDVAFGPENLGLDRTEIERRVTDALATVGMADRRGERVTALSGGERARVALAGALAMEPKYLALDEPFAGLDDPTRRAVLSDVRRLVADGVGVLLVTHDLRDLLAPADRLVVLADGRVAAEGPPETLRDRLRELGVRAPGDES